MKDRDKYIQKAKNVEKRINKYSREAERLVNRLSDKTIEFIDELSSTKNMIKKRRADPPLFFSLKVYFWK